jgi:hypothetical protein
MANLSTYLANALLAHSVGKTAYTEPTTYLALFTTTPTMPAGTGGTEVSGGAYARVAVGTLFGAASGEAITNSSAVNFTTATVSWGTVVGLGIYDASTVGNLLWAGPLTTSKVIGSGDTFSVPISDLTISFA